MKAKLIFAVALVLIAAFALTGAAAANSASNNAGEVGNDCGYGMPDCGPGLSENANAGLYASPSRNPPLDINKVRIPDVLD